MDREAFDIQTLRLLKAFFKIEDTNARDIIVTLAEAAERGATLSATVHEPSSKVERLN